MPGELDELVLIPKVRAVSNGLALICQLRDGRRFSVPSRFIGPASQVRNPGDIGTLSVPRWFANEHDLIGNPDPDGKPVK
jgi:hypothetical protein